jgi:hypothetical protein
MPLHVTVICTNGTRSHGSETILHYFSGLLFPQKFLYFYFQFHASHVIDLVRIFPFSFTLIALIL